ncbi:MAG: hypothetical protein FWD33_01240 [Alphaproteobacteria bacterium]|nr:hypothetical protein [Alphaproteobacteria bacterium]
MKKILLAIICCASLLTLNADGNPQPRGRAGQQAAPQPQQQQGNVEVGRAATGRGQQAVVQQQAAQPVAARAGVTRGQAAAPQPAPASVNAARSAVPTARAAAPAATASTAPANAARAAQRQTTINRNVQIQAAVQATGLFQEECRVAFFGCLDQFCFLGNEDGARCACSDDRADIDKISDEVARLEALARYLSTVGVERAALGANVDIIFGDGTRQYDARGNVVNDPLAQIAAQRQTHAQLIANLFPDDEEDMWDEFAAFDAFAGTTEIAAKTGRALFNNALAMCRENIKRTAPQCVKDESMLLQLYSTTIRSDCAAYRIELEARKKTMELKVAEAEKMVRETALEVFGEQNRYNRGECMLEFRRCMSDADRGGCGPDFSNCAGEAARAALGGTREQHMTIAIPDRDVTIRFAASTMEVLDSKRFICERVLDSCVAVRQFVWGDFLREIAPTMRQAELNAESNLRTNCMASVTNCALEACKAGDLTGEGNLDACLANPNMVRHMCKVQLDTCGTMQEGIWEWVSTKLGAMRVDACTKEVDDCFRNSLRCGKDLSGCLGLDLESLQAVCPLAALPICTRAGSITTWDPIAQITMGIFLNVDNAMLDQCQNLVDSKMMEICGSTTDCNVFTDERLGAGSLRGQKMSNGDYLLSGLIQFGRINMEPTTIGPRGVNRIGASVTAVTDGDGNMAGGIDCTPTRRNPNAATGPEVFNIDVCQYINYLQNEQLTSRNFGVGGMTPAQIIETITSELLNMQGQINRIMELFVNDPQISMCVHGRDMRNVTSSQTATTARFPNLLMSTSAIITGSAITNASNNFQRAFQEEMRKASAAASAEIANFKCIQLAEGGGVPSGGGDEFISPIAIFIPASGIKTEDLRTVSERMVQNPANNTTVTTWTTWNETERVCTLHRETIRCERFLVSKRWFGKRKHDTRCEEPELMTTELRF